MGPAVSAQTEASSLLEGGSTPSRDAAQKEDQMPTGVQDAVLAEKASDMQDEKSAGGLTAPTRGAWIRFSVAFGLIHGCAVCAMTYASTFIGPELASKTLSVFYATYTVSTLAIAEGFATAVGTPAAMLTGFVAYMTLLGAYGAYGALGDSPYETLGAAIVTAASVVGGVGGAFIWIAQTMLYGAAAGTELKNEFATIFATLYVSLEAFAKIAVALGLWAGWRETEAITLLVVASALTWGAVVVAPELFGLTFGVTTRRTTTPGRRRSDERRYDYYGSSKKVPSALSRTEKQKMPHAAQQASATSVMVRSVARVARAHVAERRIVTLAPLPLAFGFAEGFYTEWMTSHVAARRGGWAVGVASSVTTVVAGGAALGLGGLTARYGRPFAVGAAVATYVATAALLLGVPSVDVLARWAFLAPAFALEGVNRAVFENSTKFVYADTFHLDNPHRSAAFAAIYFHSGLSSAVAFALVDAMDLARAGIGFVLLAGCIAVGFWATVRVFGDDDDARRPPRRAAATTTTVETATRDAEMV
mmetsp:Transcript_6567/g.27594  ORF Transcript_6567/g.27594 Transcript_6567/m.27594 type:complete len:533 (-) Transcript_6567:89-1687(-)